MPRSKFRTLLHPHGAARRSIAIIAVIATSALLSIAVWLAPTPTAIQGTPTMIGPHRYDPRFPGVNPVSGTSAEWISAVCRPLHQLPGTGIPQFSDSGFVYLSSNDEFAVPHALHSATCQAKETDASDPVLLVAQYPSEDPMQVDLARNGFEWYCFAVEDDELIVIATRLEESATSARGLGVSPLLQSLQDHFSFVVYADPGE